MYYGTDFQECVSGDIANFPTDIKVVFVRHEILANDDQNVLQVCLVRC